VIITLVMYSSILFHIVIAVGLIL